MTVTVFALAAEFAALGTLTFIGVRALKAGQWRKYTWALDLALLVALSATIAVML